MSFLDAEDRAYIALVAPAAVRWMMVAVGIVMLVLLFAVTAGWAVWLFRFTSGY